eukprot:CAMPEP_0202346326 /NCGR_PEP_ID=MMETSP1126-20121109/5162_1 /ASSEMBLY_ACC=CAM_ASM_000457 /TAXON_ID=3047 /ORGANISM="Dunaliella tertiolecta, Strain CCMP1320" /LENGTH=511 /DNA_ID=CAMNT_0048937713 /DNA_START=35 /DNA_END=1572 /DNA_ORIENTATION=-
MISMNTGGTFFLPECPLLLWPPGGAAFLLLAQLQVVGQKRALPLQKSALGVEKASYPQEGEAKKQRLPPPVQAQLSANQWLEQEGMGVGAGLVDDNTDVAPAVEMLLNISGSRQRTVSLIKTHPEVLQAPLEAWQIFLGTYGISDSSFFKLLSSHPHLFTSGVALFSAGRGMAYLQSLGLSAREVSQVVCRVPELLVRCDPDHCAPVVHFLTSPLAGEGSSNEGSGTSGRGDDDDDDDGVQGLGLDAEELRCLVARCPSVLLQDVGTQLRPRVHFLLQIGLNPGQVKQLVLVSSSHLVRPPEQSLSQPINFLQCKCGMDKQQTVHIIASAPGVAHMSESNLERKWSYLCQEVFSRDPHEQAASGLKMQSRDVAPRTKDGARSRESSSSGGSGSGSSVACNDFNDSFAASSSKARAAVLAYPRVFEKSLLTDIGPRFCYARDKGLLTKLLDFNELHGSVMISLGRMLEADNVQFPFLMDSDSECFEQYCRQWKRSSQVQLTVPNAPFSESSW